MKIFDGFYTLLFQFIEHDISNLCFWDALTDPQVKI